MHRGKFSSGAIVWTLPRIYVIYKIVINVIYKVCYDEIKI